MESIGLSHCPPTSEGMETDLFYRGCFPEQGIVLRTAVYYNGHSAMIMKMEEDSMKKFLQEFKAFALRGNVLDLAVGVLIGGAFSGLVTSLTQNIISPIIGLFGGANFNDYVLRINGATIQYGAFITAVINFLIMAFIVFLIVKGIHKIESFGRRKEAPPAPVTKTCPFCRSQIDIQATRCPHCTSLLESDPS